MSQDNRALWEKGTCSDVEFVVQGYSIQAHSPVLCARSEVFQKQLTVGMQESMSKVIVIEDCDPATFRAFLQFLYTDTFPNISELMAQRLSQSDEKPESFSRISRLQALLAVSHKYEVTRLLRWCESQLCDQLSNSEVISILCQAHLLEARHLEKACLAFIKEPGLWSTIL